MNGRPAPVGSVDPVAGVRLSGCPDFPSMGVIPAARPVMDLKSCQGFGIILEAAACVVTEGVAVVVVEVAAASAGLRFCRISAEPAGLSVAVSGADAGGPVEAVGTSSALASVSSSSVPSSS